MQVLNKEIQQLEKMGEKMELAQSKVVDQIEKYQKLNEKTTAERESLLAQITEAGSSKTEMQNHVTQLENDAKEVNKINSYSYCKLQNK